MAGRAGHGVRRVGRRRPPPLTRGDQVQRSGERQAGQPERGKQQRHPHARTARDCAIIRHPTVKKPRAYSARNGTIAYCPSFQNSQAAQAH